MRTKHKIFICLIIGLISCHTGIRLTQTYIGGWTEKQIGFVNSIPHVDSKNGYFDLIMECKWGGIGLQDFYLSNEKPFTWIRKSDNIIILHNTIKEIGYKNFISDSVYNQPMRFQDKFGGMYRHDWEDLSLANIVDNLIKTYYQAIRIDTGYYEEFWNRRAKEGNNPAVIKVLEEIKKIYSDLDITNDYASQIVNDTIERLLKFDLQLQGYDNKPTKDFLLEYFDYLHTLGLSHSAYNLVIEKYPGMIELDSVISILNLDTIPENDYWNTRNDGTWIYTYDNNGP